MLSQGCPVRQTCQVPECTRSTYDYQPQRSTYDYQPQHCDNTTPQAAIVCLTETWPTYGYRRTAALRPREHVRLNCTQVARRMDGSGLLRQRLSAAHVPYTAPVLA